jgi:hypothetical protein
MKLPKAEQEAAESATEALILAAEDRGPIMHARIGTLRALNRHIERVFSDRKDQKWGSGSCSGTSEQASALTKFLKTRVGYRTDKNQRQIHNRDMGQAERPTCPHCGTPLLLALPPGGKGPRTFQCFECDRPDPLKTDQVAGWLNGELGREQ